jgi:hypothetical protein
LWFFLVGVFHLVEFTESETAAVISSEWMIDGDTCCYPKWHENKVKLAAKKHVCPGENWELFSVRVKITRGGTSLLSFNASVTGVRLSYFVF